MTFLITGVYVITSSTNFEHRLRMELSRGRYPINTQLQLLDSPICC